MMNEEQLTDRQYRILRFLIEEYVESGKPVGSRTLIEEYPLDVSSATVRNEMSVLERVGYVEHPHRSAGSVPTDSGYRLYVERSAGSSRLPASDQLMIRHQFRQVESQLEGWMQLAASVLSEVSGNLSLITSPRNRKARLRHFELLSLQPRLALLILVTQDSSVTQSMMHLESAIDQQKLSEIADELNLILANRTAAQVHVAAAHLKELDLVITAQVASTLEANDAGERTEVRHDGIEYMVQQPEFTGGSDMHSIFRLMRGGTLLSMILPQLEHDSDVQIFIGAENRVDALQPFGIVIASYGIDDQVTGLLGIVGPRRMQYDRSISSVRYMADLMSDLMQDLYHLE